jgi:hypothetical protein
MWLRVTHTVVDDWEHNRTVVAIVVTTLTALLTGGLVWLATAARTPSRGAWICALAPAFGAANAGLSCAAVAALTDSGAGGTLGVLLSRLMAGGLFGLVFAAPMGGVFGLVLAPLVHRFASLRALASHDVLPRTAQFCGAWLMACAVLAASFALGTGGPLAYGYPAALAGALLFGAGTAAARRRAAWLSRVRAGIVRGWRVVDAQEGEHGPELPLFDSRQPRCDAVLVRVPETLATYREVPQPELAIARVPRA